MELYHVDICLSVTVPFQHHLFSFIEHLRNGQVLSIVVLLRLEELPIKKLSELYGDSVIQILVVIDADNVASPQLAKLLTNLGGLAGSKEYQVQLSSLPMSLDVILIKYVSQSIFLLK